MKSFTKNKKILVGVLSTVIVSVVGGGIYFYQGQSEQQESENQKQFSSFLNNVDEVENEVKGYYVNENENYIDPTIDNKVVSLIQEEVSSLTDSLEEYKSQKEHSSLEERLQKVNHDLKDISYKQDIEKEVNALFKEEVISGEDIKIDVSIVDDLDSEQIKQVAIEEANENEDEWKGSIRLILNSATEQVKQIASATEKVKGFYEEEEVIANPLRDNYESIKAEIEQIKNEKAKKYLTEKLSPVLAKIKDNEQLVLEQQEEKEKEESLAVEQQKEKEEAQVSEQNTAQESKQLDVAKSDSSVAVSSNEKTSSSTPSKKTSEGSSNAGYNESESTTKTTPPTENSSSNSGSGVVEWESTSELTGGDFYGGIYDSLEDIPGLETGNPPWEE